MRKFGTTLRLYVPEMAIADQFCSGAARDRVVSPNERDLLRLVRQIPGIARAEMTERLSLTQQSIHRLIDGLVVRGLCRLEGPRPGTGRGQPSPTVYLDPGFAVSAGIAVDTDAVNICLFDFAGTILSTTQVEIAGRPLSYALEQVARSVHDQLRNVGIDRKQLFGAGLAIPGFLEEGSTFNTPLPLHEWSLVELGPLMARVLDCPIWTENIAKAAASCEAMLGIGRHIGSFAYLAFSYGFGGAIILNGELWRGVHGNAGEMSAMFTQEEMAQRPTLEFLLAILNRNRIALKTVHEIQKNFDPTWPGIDEWIDLVLPTLNRTVNAVYATFDPGAIIFGGQIPKVLADQLISRVHFVRAPRHGRLMKAPRLLSTDLEVNAAAVGAAVMPFKAMFF